MLERGKERGLFLLEQACDGMGGEEAASPKAMGGHKEMLSILADQ
jgi:hypothetical protein